MSTRGMRSAAASSQAWSGPAPAKGHQRKVARIVPSFDRDGPDGPLHVRVGDADHAPGSRLQRQAELPGQVLHPGPGALQVERHAAPQKVIGIQAAQNQVRIGHGDIEGVIAPIADRSGVRARRFRAPLAARHPHPAGRSSRRPRRRYGCR